MAGPRTLVLEIHHLTEHLYRVLQEQVGASLTELVEHVFDLAKARRAGDIKASRELEKLVAGLDERKAEVILAAACLLFDLMNMAEDRHRIRMLRDRERRSGDRPRPESIGAALAYLGKEGYSAEQIQGFLDKLSIEPVFTAHPTEAKRRTVRAKLKRIQQCLAGLEQHGLLPREKQRLENIIHSEMVSLWQTEPHRPDRPTVIEEVERALFLCTRSGTWCPGCTANWKRGCVNIFTEIPFLSPVFCISVPGSAVTVTAILLSPLRLRPRPSLFYGRLHLTLI